MQIHPAHNRPKPIALIILDGWGYREEKEANAILQAKTPVWNHLWETYPHTLIEGCGPCVGLPEGQMGNSEVGHLNMGAGRIVYQDLSRIDRSIEDGTFATNPALDNAIRYALQHKKNIHVLGLLSPGGVHSHERHLYALIDVLAKEKLSVYFHAFLDGRDTPPSSASASIMALEKHCQIKQCGKIASHRAILCNGPR